MSLFSLAFTGEPLDDRTVKELFSMLYRRRDINLDERPPVDEWMLADFALVGESMRAERLADAALHAPVELLYLGALLARGGGEMGGALPPIVGFPSRRLVGVPLSILMSYKYRLEMEIDENGVDVSELLYSDVLQLIYESAREDGVDLSPSEVRRALRATS